MGIHTSDIRSNHHRLEERMRLKHMLWASSILLIAVFGTQESHAADGSYPTPMQEACRRYCGPAFDTLEEAVRVARAWLRGDVADIDPIASGADKSCGVLPGTDAKTYCCPKPDKRLFIRIYGGRNPYADPKAHYRIICR